MNEAQIRTLAQVQRFLDGTLEVRFTPLGEEAARYRHIAEVLQRFGYGRLKRRERGWVLRHLRATCGFSRAQQTRPVSRVLQGEPLVKLYGVLVFDSLDALKGHLEASLWTVADGPDTTRSIAWSRIISDLLTWKLNNACTSSSICFLPGSGENRSKASAPRP